MLTRTVFLAAFAGLILVGCATAKPPPAAAAPAVKAAPKLAVTVPDGWRLVQEGASADGSAKMAEFVRIDGQGVVVATMVVMAQPAAAVNVAEVIEKISQAIGQQGGTVVVGGDPAKGNATLAYFVDQGEFVLTGLIVFKPAPSDPSKLIIVEGRWMGTLTDAIRPEVDGVIGSADFK